MTSKLEKGRFSWRECEGEKFRIILSGDLCPRGIPAENAAAVMAKVKPFFSGADLRIVQWECALCDDGEPIIKSGPNLKEPVDAVKYMTELDTDVALLANNHTGDFGPDKALETIEVVKAAGIAPVGVGKNAVEAARPLRIERNGLRISILNFCEHEFGVAGRNTAGAAKLDPFPNIAAVRAERPNADILIVAVHGGHEYNPYPSPRMTEWYRQIAGAGADLFFACHTHTPGGFEVVDGVPVIYSPGNFYFPARKEEANNTLWTVGYLTAVTFDRKGAFEIELIPCTQMASGVFPFPAEYRDKFDAYINRINEVIGDPGLVEDFFESWCIIAGLNGYFRVFGRERGADLKDPAVIKSWMGMRNLFTCDAHRDLLRKTLMLIEESRLEEAEKYVPQIREMQDPEWLAEVLASRDKQ